MWGWRPTRCPYSQTSEQYVTQLPDDLDHSTLQGSDCAFPSWGQLQHESHTSFSYCKIFLLCYFMIPHTVHGEQSDFFCCSNLLLNPFPLMNLHSMPYNTKVKKNTHTNRILDFAYWTFDFFGRFKSSLGNNKVFNLWKFSSILLWKSSNCQVGREPLMDSDVQLSSSHRAVSIVVYCRWLSSTLWTKFWWRTFQYFTPFSFLSTMTLLSSLFHQVRAFLFAFPCISHWGGAPVWPLFHECCRDDCPSSPLRTSLELRH